jgi:DNA invertase Pin-like site-specific DNA recombinase
MKCGYARKSATEENLDHQLQALKRAGCQRMFQDDAGAKHPALRDCLKTLQANDSLVIWRLDALAPSLHDVIVIVDELHTRRIKLLSLSEPLNTAVADGVWIYRAFAALRQCERNLLIERTQHGMKAARARGIKVGAKPKLSDQEIAQAKALLEEGHSQKNVADYLKISRSTLYRALLAREALSVPEGNGRGL